MTNMLIASLLYFIPLCIGVYIAYLLIKALKTYIKNHS